MATDAILNSVRHQRVGVLGAVFVDDSAAANPDATRCAIESMAAGEPGEANVILIAGGVVAGFDYHALGPVLARRVKRAWLVGEAAETLRAAWSLFTACSPVATVLEAVSVAVKGAVPGDVVLFSPACSFRGGSPDDKNWGDVFREAVKHWGRTTGRRVPATGPSRGAGSVAGLSMPSQGEPSVENLSRRFLRESAAANALSIHPQA